MKNFPSQLAAAGALGAMLTTTAFAFAFTGKELSSQAKVGIAQARAVAHRTAAGTIVSEELEKERSGSGLRYTFDIKGPRGVREVGVDAKTGRVIENSAEAM